MSTDKLQGLSQLEYMEKQLVAEQQKFIVETNRRLQELEIAQQAISNNMSTMQGEFKYLSVSTEDIIDQAKSELEYSVSEIKVNLNDLKRDCEGFSWRLDKSDKFQAYCIQQGEFQNLRAGIDVKLEHLHQLHESEKQEFRFLLERQRLEFKEALKSLKEEILAIPTGVPQLKDELHKRIDFVELNGQNGVLRSTNNEKQLMLLERKIENLYQLIKRIDLSTQEQA